MTSDAHAGTARRLLWPLIRTDPEWWADVAMIVGGVTLAVVASSGLFAFADAAAALRWGTATVGALFAGAQLVMMRRDLGVAQEHLERAVARLGPEAAADLVARTSAARLAGDLAEADRSRFDA